MKIKIKYIEKLINAGIDFTHKNNDGKNILSYIDENPTFNDDIFINGLANIIFHTITNKILYDKTIKTEHFVIASSSLSHSKRGPNCRSPKNSSTLNSQY